MMIRFRSIKVRFTLYFEKNLYGNMSHILAGVGCSRTQYDISIIMFTIILIMQDTFMLLYFPQ